MRVREGRPGDAALLSELALRSKSYWGYDADFLEACREELRLSPDDFDQLVVRVAQEHNGAVVGFYALGPIDQDQAEVGFFFVELARIGCGIGRVLFENLVNTARERGLRRLHIDADPGAATFYERMGAEHIRDVPSSSIPGRLLPRYRLQID